jgi:arylsulfatase A-like enzyme
VLLMGGPFGARLSDGRLADVAPTLLALMGLAQPAAMTGRSLLNWREAGGRVSPGAGSAQIAGERGGG